MSFRCRVASLGAVILSGTFVLGLVGVPAGAHVTVQPDEAEKGSFATFAIQVPNERDDASTVKVEVQLPQKRVIQSVAVQPVPGWAVSVQKRTLDEPIEGEEGDTTEAASTIRWEGGSIDPGQFQQFLVSAGPLPEKGKQLVLKTIQTYSTGEVVRWIETTPKGGPEPEFPSPVLELVSGGGDEEDDHGH